MTNQAFTPTDEQRAVIEHAHGHARVTAVAGSGKTATLVARVARLLQQGADPQRIAVLMFNVAASRQFAERLAAAAPGRPLPPVRTFHSMGYRLVENLTRRGQLPARRLEERDGLRQKLAREALHAAFEAQGEESPSKTQEEEFLGFIERVKADIIEAREVFEQQGFAARSRPFIDAFDRFETQRQEAGVRFYDDLLYEPVRRLRQEARLAAWVGNRIDHLLVDEYQDVNAVQDTLLRLIAGERAAVMVVGDADQCIYEWRGARPEYLTRAFGERYPDAARYTLSRSFRYGPRLALAANHVIRHNTQREDTFSLAAEGNPDTRIERLAVGANAPHPVPELLRGWLAQGRGVQEAAVLVRLFSASIPIELALLGEGIPYHLLGHAPVFESPEGRALLGALELAGGRLGEQPAARRRETAAAMLRLPHLGLKAPLLAQTAERIAADPRRGARVLEQVAAGLPNPRHGERVRDRAQLWRELAEGLFSGRAPAAILRHYIDASDLRRSVEWSSARSEDAENSLAACDALVDFAAASGGDLPAFLDRVEHLRGVAAQPGEDARALLITSVHRAKGLEWPLVIVADLKEGRFPRLENGQGDLEAERRLFYVAATRARERLVLLTPSEPEPVSRFVGEAEIELSEGLGGLIAERAEGDYPGASAVGRRYLDLIGARIRLSGNASEPLPAPGGRVRHPRFGAGTLLGRNADGSQVEVAFDDGTRKWLVVRYARLEAL